MAIMTHPLSTILTLLTVLACSPFTFAMLGEPAFCATLRSEGGKSERGSAVINRPLRVDLNESERPGAQLQTMSQDCFIYN